MTGLGNIAMTKKMIFGDFCLILKKVKEKFQEFTTILFSKRFQS